jgi:hypothetical protein
MPGAIPFTEDDESFWYTIGATIAAAQAFYEAQMPALGWTPFAVGSGETGALILIYQKGGQTATVSIFTLESATNVLMVLS